MLFHHLLLSSLMLAPTASFIYPQPSQQLDGDWEPVDQYRQHHNITYNYEPVNIDPELCRHITEDVCRADDEAAARVTTQRREERRLNPRTGSYTFLVLLVQFADHTDRVLPSKEYYEELCNGTGPSGVNPVGSISDFFAENSYGNFNVECQVLDWQVSPTTEAAFAAGKSGLLGAERSQDFFRPILDDFEAASDQFAFFELDRLMGGPGGDGNQQIELVVLHSGYAAEGVGTDCTGASREDRIQSVGYKGTDSGGWTTSDGNFEVNGYTIASALDPSNPECVDASPAKMGIVTHEYVSLAQYQNISCHQLAPPYLTCPLLLLSLTQNVSHIWNVRPLRPNAFRDWRHGSIRYNVVSLRPKWKSCGSRVSQRLYQNQSHLARTS